MVNILVSEQAATVLVPHLDGGDRLLRMTADGVIRLDGDPISIGEARPAVAWLTADVLVDPVIKQRFVDLVLTAETIDWVQSVASGTDIAGFDRLLDRRFRVCNSHAGAIPIAEFVFASVLEHYQDLEGRRRLQRERTWRKDQFREVHGTTWLVIGLGATGSEVAKRAAAFGATVIGVRRNVLGDEPVRELIALPALPAHVDRADIVVLAAPATPATHHLVDAAFLASMKAGSVLVNVARGSLVDEAALLASLAHGQPDWRSRTRW